MDAPVRAPHTLYPKSVRLPTLQPSNKTTGLRVLKEVSFNKKMSGHKGIIIKKGWWAGMPMFNLTLEERKTCPVTCQQWQDCLAPGMRVLTAELKWVRVEDLVPGQEIIGFDETPVKGGRRRKTKIATVEKVGRAKRLSFLVETSQGNVIASGGHLWVARSTNKNYRWHRTDELQKGDKIQYVIAPWGEDKSYDAGRVRGFVEGEGYVGTYGNQGYLKSRLGWAQLPGKLLNEINAIVRKLGFSLSQADRISGVNNSNVIRLVDLRGGWREVARFLGTYRPTRLIERAREVIAGHDLGGRGGMWATVHSKRLLGEIEVVTLSTSTKTLIAEGFAAHNCYGNNMPYAHRFEAGADVEHSIALDVDALAARYPSGFVVRLHVLGDFYSTGYVRLWEKLLELYPALRVFGYTHRWAGTEIGDEITRVVTGPYADRFRIMRSDPPADAADPLPGAYTLPEGVKEPIPGSIVCPWYAGKTESCLTCGLCWGKTKVAVSFIRH